MMDIELPDIKDLDIQDTSDMLEAYDAGGAEQPNWWDISQVQTQKGGRNFLSGVNKGTMDALILPTVNGRMQSPEQRKISDMQNSNIEYNTGISGKAGEFVGESGVLLPMWGKAASAGSRAVGEALSLGKAFTNREALSANKKAIEELTGHAFGPQPASMPIDTGARINAINNASKNLSTRNIESVFGDNLAQSTVTTPAGMLYDKASAEANGNGDNYNIGTSAAMNFGMDMLLGYPLAKLSTMKAKSAEKDIQEQLTHAKSLIEKDKNLRFDSEYIARKIDTGEAKPVNDADGNQWLDFNGIRVKASKNKHGIAVFKPSDIYVQDARTKEYIPVKEAIKIGQASEDDLAYMISAFNGGVKGKKEPSSIQPNIKDLEKQNLKFMDLSDEEMPLYRAMEEGKPLDMSKGSKPYNAIRDYLENITTDKNAIDDMMMKIQKDYHGIKIDDTNAVPLSQEIMGEVGANVNKPKSKLVRPGKEDINGEIIDEGAAAKSSAFSKSEDEMINLTNKHYDNKFNKYVDEVVTGSRRNALNTKDDYQPFKGIDEFLSKNNKDYFNMSMNDIKKSYSAGKVSKFVYENMNRYHKALAAGDTVKAKNIKSNIIKNLNSKDVKNKIIRDYMGEAKANAKETAYKDNKGFLKQLKTDLENGLISKKEFGKRYSDELDRIMYDEIDKISKKVIDEPKTKEAEAKAFEAESKLEAEKTPAIPDLEYKSVSNLVDDANKAVKKYKEAKGESHSDTTSLKDINKMNSDLNKHISMKESDLKKAKTELDKMGYSDIKAREDKMKEIKMREDELNNMHSTQSKLENVLKPVKERYANDTIDTKNVLSEYKRITGKKVKDIDEAYDQVISKKDPMKQAQSKRVITDEGERPKNIGEKASEIESYLKNKAPEEITSYKESYMQLETKAATDENFAKIYKDVKELQNRYSKNDSNMQIDAYTNYLSNGYKIDAAEADMLASMNSNPKVKSTLITSDDGAYRLSSNELYSSKAGGKLFDIDKDGNIVVNKSAVKDILYDKYGSTFHEDIIDQLSRRAEVVIRNDVRKLTKSGVSVYDINDVFTRNYFNPSNSYAKMSKTEEKFVDATMTSAGEMPDVGPQVMFRPSKQASRYMNNESGFLQDTKIYTAADMPGISKIAKGKRGFIDEQGNIYLNNNGEINASNMLTVLHELAHQFADATSKNKLSHDESYLTAMASTVRRRLFENNYKMFDKKMKSSEVQTVREVDPKDVAQFEAYVINTLNNPHSGFAKWANRSISEVYASNIGKDSVTKIKDTLSKHNSLFKSVDTFVNELVGDSPTLTNMFAYDSKRLTSIAASHRLKAVEARMQQMEAEIRSEFEKNSGNMSDKQLELMGEFINSGGYQLLDIVKVSEIADFLRGTKEGEFSLNSSFNAKRFEDNGDELIAKFISQKLGSKLNESFDLKYSKRIAELKKIIELRDKDYAGTRGTSDITTSGSSTSEKFSDKLEAEGSAGRLEQDVKDEHIKATKKAQEELDSILQKKADQVGALQKTVLEYVKSKKLMEMETKHIADEQFYREGRSQIDGKNAIFSSSSTKSFIDVLVNTISNNKAISDLNLKADDVRNLLDEIPIDIQTKLQRQMDGAVMSIRLRKAIDSGKLNVDELGALIQHNPKGVEYVLGSWSKVARQLETEGIPTRQFGFNPINKASYRNRPLKIVPTNEIVKEENVVHRIGKDFAVVIDEAKASLGKQKGLSIADSKSNSMKINTRDLKVTGDKIFYRHKNKEDEFVGYAKDFNVKNIGQGKYEITLKNKDMINNQNAYSMNVTDAYMSNIRSLIHNRIGKKANNDFVASMKEAGIIKPSYEAKPGEKTFKYNGVNYVVDKRYAHNIFGTKGIEVTNKYIAQLVNSMQGIIGIAKSKVLTTRLKSYINNTVANNITVAFTTKMPLGKILSENDKSMKNITDFARIAGESGIRNARAKYPDIYEFMYKIGGHDSLIRDAVRNNGKVNQNQFIDILAGLSNSGLENDIRSTNFMEGTRAGDKLASLFDATEVKQKLTFYRFQKRKGLSADRAMEETMLAFPTYAENLTDVMSLTDEVVLFMKYFNNIPKITRYALNKNSIGMLTMFAGMIAAKESLYYVLPENSSDEWYKEHGFVKIRGGEGGASYVNVASANNYNLESFVGDPNVVSASLLENHTTGLGSSVKLWNNAD